MKTFRAEFQQPMRRAGVSEYFMSEKPTQTVTRRVAVFFPRLTSRKPRVVQ